MGLVRTLLKTEVNTKQLSTTASFAPPWTIFLGGDGEHPAGSFFPDGEAVLGSNRWVSYKYFLLGP